MTARISIAAQGMPNLQPRADANAETQAGSGDFSSLLEAFRGNLPATDFLGQKAIIADAAAKPFNADGFFDQHDESRIPAATAIPIEPGRDAANAIENEPAESIIPKAQEQSPADHSISKGDLKVPATSLRVGAAFRQHSANAAAGIKGSLLHPELPPSFEMELAEPAAENMPPNQDRPRANFKISVEEASVLIAGPAALTDEDESRLIERVSELLIEHGHSLADIRLNGRLLTPKLKDKR